MKKRKKIANNQNVIDGPKIEIHILQTWQLTFFKFIKEKKYL